ncbi:MAG TPA: DUF454 domain-containing protein [Mariprofundaceae bacterium]|nr:DUF454 domain-containing protein [Mariprofundaceae bacterium]
MRKLITNHAFILFGWFFVLLGLVGVVLPILPTTPFIIVAAALFAKSSPRFHQMLLNNKYIGDVLKDWEKRHLVRRTIKKRATILIVITFSISIAILHERIGLQLMLVGIAATLLFFLWRLQDDTGS